MMMVDRHTRILCCLHPHPRKLQAASMAARLKNRRNRSASQDSDRSGLSVKTRSVVVIG